MFNRHLVLKKNDVMRLLGESSGDERFPDGHWIMTSAVTAQGKDIYVTETPTVYNVGRELTLEEFCEEVLMKEKFKTEGLKYCINLAQIIQANMDKNLELEVFLDKLYELRKYDLNDWS